MNVGGGLVSAAPQQNHVPRPDHIIKLRHPIRDLATPTWTNRSSPLVFFVSCSNLAAVSTDVRRAACHS